MKLTRLRFINFKKFTDEVLFEFKDSNLISGKNGEGKTSIKDALTFCLYNRTADGSNADSSKYISTGKPKCLVEAIFESKGQTHTVVRERTDKQTRITYQDGSQSEDDSKITQELLESIVPSFKDFYSVFSIGWFMSRTDREKRDYILKLTPKIDRAKLFEKLGGMEEDIEDFGLLFDDLEKTHKNLLTNRLSNERDIDDMNVFIKESSPLDFPVNDATDVSEELSKIKEQEKEQIHLKYKQEEYDKIKQHNISVVQKNKDLSEKIAKIQILVLSMPSQENINSLTFKKDEFNKQISLPDKNCPKCFQVIPNSHRDSIAKINSENKARLEELEDLLLEEQRTYTKALIKWEENEENKQKKLMYETQFDDPMPLPEEPGVIEGIRDEGVLENLEVEQRKFIEQENTIKVLTEQEDHRVKKLNSYKDKIGLLILSNDRLNRLISIFSPKGIPAEEMNQKLEPLKKKFKEFIPNSDIVTLELLKNEMSYKEVFKILVDEKDYSKLSLGEQTRVDISISKTINSMLVEKIDMFFLDNSEVLDSSISIPSQSFICKVSNQPLKIN